MTGQPARPGRNGCTSGKFAFASRREARRYLRRFQQTGAQVQDAYKCPECGAWHLTHYPKKRTRAFTRRQQENTHDRSQPSS